MRSTLFFIPHEIAGIPLFGVGLLLGGLLIGFAVWLAVSITKKRPLAEIVSSLPMWGVAAAILTIVMPAVEQTWPDGTPIGLPIRGYGVLVLSGLLCGIGISVYRGRQLGVEPDMIIGLGFWMMLVGVLGARAFYVIQKWDEFGGESFLVQLLKIVKLTEGGLVIYGGVIGGLVGGGLFCLRNKMKLAATADLVAPGFLIGLSLGRIGCLLHGCCFGGVCDANLPSIQFPQGSGPYQAQLATGRLLGIELRDAKRPQTITQVDPGSPADRLHIVNGQRLDSLNYDLLQPDSSSDPTAPPPTAARLTVDGKSYAFSPSDLPARSLPTHPTQIYASVNALLLCILIWLLQPIPKRDGVVFCIAILLYAVSRFLLEGVRSDEAGQLGTSFTVAQLVAFGSVFGAVCGLILIRSRPIGRSWRWESVSN